MKRLPPLTGILLFTVLLLAAAPAAPAIAAPPALSTHAAGAALIDVESGRILYSHNGDEKMRIASLTKVMTAIVAIEHGKLPDAVKVTKNAYGKEGSSVYLKLGEEMSLHNLLYAMMLRSGNDAATAIAEHVGGSLDGFVYLMNEKAQWIGMENTTFQNPHGLDAEGHLSTANDMAKLTAYALKNPVFREIVKTQVKRAPNPNDAHEYTWYNKNKMLSLYEGADGVKTGYTRAAGRCLITSATRNGQQLVAVTLNDRNDWADHARMLDYGFKFFPLKEWVDRGQPLQGQPYVAGQSFAYPVAEGEESAMSAKPVMFGDNEIAARFGQKGILQFTFRDQIVGSVPLYEPGHPLLNEQQSAFRPLAEPSRPGFGGAFKAVLRALFMSEY